MRTKICALINRFARSTRNSFSKFCYDRILNSICFLIPITEEAASLRWIIHPHVVLISKVRQVTLFSLLSTAQCKTTPELKFLAQTLGLNKISILNLNHSNIKRQFVALVMELQLRFCSTFWHWFWVHSMLGLSDTISVTTKDLTGQVCFIRSWHFWPYFQLALCWM